MDLDWTKTPAVCLLSLKSGTRHWTDKNSLKVKKQTTGKRRWQIVVWKVLEGNYFKEKQNKSIDISWYYYGFKK